MPPLRRSPKRFGSGGGDLAVDTLPAMAKSTAQDRSARLIVADEQAVGSVREALADLCHPDPTGWTRVKDNPSRTVYRGRLGDQDVYLKHFHNKSLAHRLGRRLGFFDAVCELRFAQYLASQGVETVWPIAAMGSWGSEWLLTRAVKPAEPADQWHLRQLAGGREGQRQIRLATRALAEAVGKMHAAGVVHRDLHAGNILIRTSAGRPCPVVMDLHRARRRRWLSRAARARNLAQLFHDRYDCTTRCQRLRFLRHYLAASAAAGSLKGWAALIESLAASHTRRQLRQRDRRVFGSNRYFSPIRLPAGWRGHVVLASKRKMAGSRAAEMQFDLASWQEALSRPDELFSGPGVVVVKDSRSSQIVRRKLQVGGHQLDVYCKRARRKWWWKAPLDCFRKSRALRAFGLGHELLTRRIATALPLAALERRRGRLLLDNILITEAIDAASIGDFVQTWLGTSPAPGGVLDRAAQNQLGKEVLWQLGRMLRRLHDSRLAHRDLKSTNVRVSWSPGSSPEIVLVDLDGLRRKPLLTARRRYQGLMRLNVSLLKCPAVNRAGRLRMLTGYLRRPGIGRVNFKPYWRALEQWSAKTLQRQIHSRRRRQKAVRRPA